MARYDFGGTLADFVVTSHRLGTLDTLALSAATLTMWSAQSGGTRYTDLVLSGSAVSSIVVGTDGQVPKFQGPDGVTEMWVDGGGGRIRIVTLQGAPGAPGPEGPRGPAGSAIGAPIGDIALDTDGVPYFDTAPTGTGPSNTAVAGYVAAAGATKAALDSAYTALPGASVADYAVGTRLAAGTNGFSWTTKEELIARALGWVVVTDKRWAGGADPTGATVSTAAFVAALAAGGHVWVPPGTFLVYLAAVPSKTVLRGAGRDITTLKFDPAQTNQFTAMVNVKGVSDVTICDMTIDGNRSAFSASEFKHCLYIIDSARVTVERVKLQNPYGDCLYIGRNNGHCTDIRVSDVDLLNGWRNCWSIADCERGYFSKVVSSGAVGTAPQAGLDIEPNDTASVVYDLTFDSCVFLNNGTVGVQVLFFSGATKQARVKFARCRAEGNLGVGWEFLRCNRVDLVDCDSISNTGAGVDFSTTSSYINWHGGKIELNGGRGVSMVPGSGSLVRIYLEKLLVLDNGATSPNTQDGVRIDGSTATSIIDVRLRDVVSINTTTSNQRFGISTNGANVSLLRVDGGQAQGVTSAALFGDAGGGRIVRDLGGYNPLAAVTTPAVATSTSAVTNTTGVDCTVYVTGGTVSSIKVGTVTTGLTSGAISVPANQTITLTYSAAPTWVWVGE